MEHYEFYTYYRAKERVYISRTFANNFFDNEKEALEWCETQYPEEWKLGVKIRIRPAKEAILNLDFNPMEEGTGTPTCDLENL